MEIDIERMRRLEMIECEALRDMYGAVTAQVAAASGLQSHSVDGAIVTICSSIDVLAFNRVVGLGVEWPAREESIDEATAHFRRAGVGRFFVQVAPGAEPPELTDWLEVRGMTHYNNWVRLARTTDETPRVKCDLVVEQVGLDESEAYARIIRTAFGWPEPATHWVDSTFGRTGWHHYIAYDRDEPVATALLFERNGTGWLSFAATLPSHLGRGAQSALIARRIDDARRFGVTLLSVETAEDKPGKPSASNRNLRRLGFEVAYLRRNFLATLD